jgi:hypothetical protein
VDYHNYVVNYTRSVEGDSGTGVVGEGEGSGTEEIPAAGGEEATGTETGTEGTEGEGTTDATGEEGESGEEPLIG